MTHDKWKNEMEMHVWIMHEKEKQFPRIRANLWERDSSSISTLICIKNSHFCIFIHSAFYIFRFIWSKKLIIQNCNSKNRLHFRPDFHNVVLFLLCIKILNKMRIEIPSCCERSTIRNSPNRYIFFYGGVLF